MSSPRERADAVAALRTPARDDKPYWLVVGVLAALFLAVYLGKPIAADILESVVVLTLGYGGISKGAHTLKSRALLLSLPSKSTPISGADAPKE
jgi:hypothetical protein